ncbi:TcpQ domain-containing protein [Variovorax ginsengisoli]|uniref:Toxin co-regulated pilus biosynthesis protein Q C-terminal domain-containing protein n=1 Tax=Variovorax ginsengisoli TaxID=363844 RepID=A0ABT9SDH1_9BURK|nr:TcpQ domain-containing protein [Variovorax ginsengisoli]MDP9902410.1 hypothetical protein [Variovorax ginsengisoli]
MLKTAPLYAAALALCACTSAPTVKFPTGSTARVAINTTAKSLPPGYPSSSQATPLSLSAVEQIVASQSKKQIVPTEPPPEPIQLKVYLVNASEQTVLSVLRRWSRLSRIDFTWDSEADYPLTARMRAIDARDLESALEQMRQALVGVRQPLLLTVGAGGLVVQDGEILAPAPEPNVPVVANAATQAQAVDALAAAKPPRTAITSWTVDESKTLREVISTWADLANVKLNWESTSDYQVADTMHRQTFDGSLREALAQLAGQFSDIKTPLGIKFLENGGIRVYDMAPSP